MRYNKIITEIKRLSTLQVEQKMQRKTVNLVGDRTMPSWEAAYNVMARKTQLMHLFIAYGRLRGFNLPKPKNKEINEGLVENFMEQYVPEELATE